MTHKAMIWDPATWSIVVSHTGKYLLIIEEMHTLGEYYNSPVLLTYPTLVQDIVTDIFCPLYPGVAA